MQIQKEIGRKKGEKGKRRQKEVKIGRFMVEIGRSSKNRQKWEEIGSNGKKNVAIGIHLQNLG